MSVEFVLEGGCHCGNIRYSFQATVPVAELPLRACACSFCTRHGARYTSDPGGKLMIDIAEESVLSRYRFATQTAEFLVCIRCGVMPAVLARIDGRTYAVVNVCTADDAAIAARPVKTLGFDGEAPEARLARRKKNWIGCVEEHRSTPGS